MSRSVLRLIKNVIEYQPKENFDLVPLKTRGIYALYFQNTYNEKVFELVYIGMARGKNSGIRGRLNKHNKRKKGLWTHFSAFEVWDNISESEVEELEGLFRHLFKLDPKANILNKQKEFKKLSDLQKETKKHWKK